MEMGTRLVIVRSWEWRGWGEAGGRGHVLAEGQPEDCLWPGN